MSIKDSSNLRHHLRTFLRVRDEAGKFLLFRFLKHYPRECRQAGGKAQISQLVRQGVQAAAVRGYTTKFPVGEPHGGLDGNRRRLCYDRRWLLT